MKLSKQDLANIFDDAADFNGSNEQAFDACKALESDTLEIEGYEKNEWIKFDCNNEKSFPEHYASVIIAWWSEFDKRFDVMPAVFFENRFKYYASFNDVPSSRTIYWRLFPMLPKEINKSNKEIQISTRGLMIDDYEKDLIYALRNVKIKRIKANEPEGWTYLIEDRHVVRNEISIKIEASNESDCELVLSSLEEIKFQQKTNNETK